MTKSTSDNFITKIRQRLNSLTNRQMVYILIGLGSAVVVLIGVFVFIYVRDRYVAPATPNLASSAEAITHLEEQVRADPGNLPLRMSVAQGYYTMRRYADAVAQTGEVLKVQADNKPALVLHAMANLKLGDSAAALADFQKVIDLSKDSSTANMDSNLELAYYYTGRLLNQAGRYAEALPALKKALEINLSDADTWLELGRASAGIGQHQEAIDAYKQAVRFVPDFVEAYQGMDKSYQALNQTGQAGYAAGMVLFSNKEYPQAATALEAVVDQHPDVLDAYLGLGLTYEKLGERDKAITALEHYTQAQPGDVAAEQALARVRKGGQ